MADPEMTRVLHRHRSSENVKLYRRGETSLLEIASPGLRIEIAVPDGVFEWFVTVFDQTTGEKVLTDWVDHYGQSDEALRAEMREEVDRVASVLTQSQLRLESVATGWRGRKQKRVLQRKTESGWEQVLPFHVAR